MIRKSVIALLTLAAAGTCVAWSFALRDLELVSPQETEASRKESHWVLFFSNGALYIEYGSYTWLTPPSQYFASFAGWGYAHHSTTTQEYRSLKVPCWALVPLLISYPAVAFIRGPVRRWRRRQKGLCLGCGYDLTGNVSGVCSECGTRIERP